MEKILDFNEPLDVNLLDAVVNALYTGFPQQQEQAQRILSQFQENQDAWQRVDRILQLSQSNNTKFYALQILEQVVKFRWKILPKEQRDGIKNYIVNLAIQLSQDEVTLKREKLLVSKLDMVLVQIIKQEWPRNWESFIPEIVGASKANESLCENNMMILRLIYEEVFDFSSGQMTQAKNKELKESFSKEFSLIYQLCEFVLERSEKPSLLLVTLETLLRFLNWIQLSYIFETSMINNLIFKFFPSLNFRNVALECLTEIGSLSVGNLYDMHFEMLFVQFMNQLQTVLPPNTDIANAFKRGYEKDQQFIQHLSLFFSGFFRSHIEICERKPELHSLLIQAHDYLAQISLVDDLEIFKICLEYWNKLANDLYNEAPLQVQPAFSSLILGGTSSSSSSMRRGLYASVLSKVRIALIGRMPRPEEVLIVEDENGDIVKETCKDTDAIILYKSMRETLVLLTHLDCEDTQRIMLEKLSAQVDGREWSWFGLNTLCWAIGAISGAQSEEYEKRFLVTVIKDLLGLCEVKRGKDNKAVIASNIMYIVGQYPRFLRAHWKFLKTVVNKLFEFMHETHPGVQDMACDTFLKIAQKCQRKFVVTQVSETQPFLEEILSTLPQIIKDLEASQVQTFYEAIGWMIQSHADSNYRDTLTSKLMEVPNQMWNEILYQAGRSLEFLQQPDIIKQIGNILKLNVRACSSMGPCFLSQMSRIYLDMLNVYKLYSSLISSAVQTGGVIATKTSVVRSMRSVKKETLTLIETFIERSRETQIIVENFVPPLLEAIVGDYKASVADARDPEVLSLIAVIVDKLQGAMTAEVPRIFDAVFECTLGMITKNFQDYPDHRRHFFTLIRSINQHCFKAFFVMPPALFKLVIDSIVWAFKHTERHVSETGLNILLELLYNVNLAGPEVSSAFYKTYFLPLLQDVFYVLTDTFHKSGFRLQATILLEMFSAVESGCIQVPLWDLNTITDPTMNNQRFLRDYVMNLLGSAFGNLSSAQVRVFVLGLFDLNKDLPLFKSHLRDFLVQLKEFSSGDNADLYLEEKEKELEEARAAALRKATAIPGMIPPNQLPDEMND